jgi:hypothetical protein
MRIASATSTDVPPPTIESVKMRPIKGPFAAVVVPLHVRTWRETLDILSSFSIGTSKHIPQAIAEILKVSRTPLYPKRCL